MPNIVQYESKEASQGLRPQDRGAAAFEMTGRHIEATYGQIGGDIKQMTGEVAQNVDNVQSFQEISHLTAKSGELTSGLLGSLDQAAKTGDMNDPSTLAKWRTETMEPALAQFATGAQTQRGKEWALSHTNELRQTLTQHSIALQMNIAGQAAEANYHTALNSAVSAAGDSPTLTKFLRDSFLSGVTATAGASGMGAEAAAAMKTHAVEDAGLVTANGARARIDAVLNPEAVKDPKFDVDGAVKRAIDADPEARTYLGVRGEALENYGRERARTVRADAEHATYQDEKADKEAFETKFRGIVSQGLQEDGTQDMTKVKNLGQQLAPLYLMPHADVAQLDAISKSVKVDIEDRITGRMTETVPSTYNGLMSRMSIQAEDPNAVSPREVYEDMATRHLSRSDGELFLHMIDKGNDPAEQHLQKRLAEFVDSEKAAILGVGADDLANLGSHGPATPEQHARFYAFQSAMQDAVAAARRANPGLSTAELEQRLLTPGQATYLGNPNTSWMQWYTANPQGTPAAGVSFSTPTLIPPASGAKPLPPPGPERAAAIQAGLFGGK